MFVFRLAFAILRSALLFVSIVTTGWFLAAAPTQDERRLLSANATTDPMRLREAVVELRLARAALHLAPDLAISLIQRQSGGTATRADVAAGLRAIAAGRPVDDNDPSPAVTLRQVGGAKFLKPPSGG